MSDPQYAQPRLRKFQRYASLALVIASLLRCVVPDGDGFAVRKHAVMMLPLALIWFADALAEWAIEASGGWLTPHNTDKVLRTFGWIFLLFLLVRCNIDLFR